MTGSYLTVVKPPSQRWNWSALPQKPHRSEVFSSIVALSNPSTPVTFITVPQTSKPITGYHYRTICVPLMIPTTYPVIFGFIVRICDDVFCKMCCVKSCDDVFSKMCCVHHVMICSPRCVVSIMWWCVLQDVRMMCSPRGLVPVGQVPITSLDDCGEYPCSGNNRVLLVPPYPKMYPDQKMLTARFCRRALLQLRSNYCSRLEIPPLLGRLGHISKLTNCQAPDQMWSTSLLSGTSHVISLKKKSFRSPSNNWVYLRLQTYPLCRSTFITFLFNPFWFTGVPCYLTWTLRHHTHLSLTNSPWQLTYYYYH